MGYRGRCGHDDARKVGGGRAGGIPYLVYARGCAVSFVKWASRGVRGCAQEALNRRAAGRGVEEIASELPESCDELDLPAGAGLREQRFDLRAYCGH
jgi:hypothetical protein